MARRAKTNISGGATKDPARGPAGRPEHRSDVEPDEPLEPPEAADGGAAIPGGGESEQLGRQDEIFQPMSDDGDAIAAETFDEAGYLRLNPDVRQAVEQGAMESGFFHYVWYGRAEGRPVSPMPRETRNVMLLSRAHVPPQSSASETRGSIDALIMAPSGGLMIVGWIDDASQPLNCIRITGSNWRLVMDSSRIMRVRRADVEQSIGIRRAHAYGFVGFLHFDRGGDNPGPAKVELWQDGGLSTALQCSPAFVEDVELRDVALAHLASSAFFGNPAIESMSYFDRGMGAEFVALNRSITRRIAAQPYVERFGDQGRTHRGSIVVCLYGKPEFFFLQNALYSGLPGIEDYEFIYVSNSPEMAETLLREARSHELLYGLASSVVILPGNAGFGAANNTAAQFARSDRLLVVNPDVFPRDRDWAAKHTALLETAPPEEVRMFGVPLYYDDGSLMHGGMYFEVDTGLSLSGGRPSATRICRTQHYGKGAPTYSAQFTRPRPVPAVTGAFISVDRPWFEELGGFTEDFIFGHYEDADLCLKSIARGTAPWLQDVRMWHLEGKGSSRQPPHEGGSIVNRWLFSKMWMPTIDDGLTGPEPTHALMRSPARESGTWDAGQRSAKAGRPRGEA
jgi:GT2 family glycosyltransferase